MFVSNSSPSYNAPTQFQDIGGVSLAYRRFGKPGAVPLICLQHLTGTMNNWDPIHLDRLAHGREVIPVDYQGIGRSGGQTPDSMSGMARDIIAFIRALGLNQVDIFGFSIGGMVAQQIALDAPELVRRMLLVGTGPSGGEAMQQFSPRVAEIALRPNTTQAEGQSELFFSPSAKSQAAWVAWIDRINIRQVDREPEAGPEALQAQLGALAKWGQIAEDRYGALKKITQRSLVVNGDNDIMVPTANSYILHEHLPDAQLIIYEDAGHGAHFQYAEEFAEAADSFLKAA
jgi:pimeloyl-ACP methyl ester carboxylesterase